MTNYLDIKGQNVQSVASDPSPVAIGQVWYNTTSNTAKVRGFISSNTWATGATMPLVGPGQYLSYASGFGTKDAAVSARGYSPVIPPSTPNVVHYDGSTWTSHTGYPDGGTSAQGFGLQSAGIVFGGDPTPGPARNYSYDGSAWTSINGPALSVYSDMYTGGTTGAAFKTVAAKTSPTAGFTEEWDGTNWSDASATMNTSRYTSGGTRAGAGDSSAGLIAVGNAGNGPPYSLSTASESYDGSSWSSTPSASQARRGMFMSGASQTSGMIYGGRLPGPAPSIPSAFSNGTETYDGTSWTTRANGPFHATYLTGAGGAEGATTWGGDTEGASPPSNYVGEFTGVYEGTVTIQTS